MEVYSINQFLNGSTVLLTGVTGFLGGSILERLLSINPGPERVYVLVRKRRGLEPRSRVDEILASPLFGNLDVRTREKVQVIPGDVKIENLGLSDHNRDLLLSTCTHVFHSAASISFATQLESAVRINLLGTRYVLRLTKKMPNLRSMVHVSTAYVNCTRKSDEYLEEKLYPSEFEATKFADMIEQMSSEEMEMRSKEFLGNHANTYTFTKHMAENLLKAERGKVPLSIVRPSIVLNSWKRPFGGWVDNVNNGACGFIAGIGKGLFRTFQAEPDGRLDIIPVDIVVSTILAASTHAAKNPDSFNIFHCTSSSENSTNWSEYCDEIVKSCRNHPCKDVVWYPEACPRRNWLRNAAVLYLFQIFPAHIFNFLWQFKRPGDKHLLLNVQQKFAKGDAYTHFFAIRQWSFSRRNAIALAKGLAIEERNDHPMNPSEIQWDRYFEICVLGMRQYFHKEGSVTTDRARRHMKWLKNISVVTPFLAYLVFWYLLVVFQSANLSTTCAAVIAGFFILFITWL